MPESPTIWALTFGIVAFVASKATEAVFRGFTHRKSEKEARRNLILQRVESVTFECRDLAISYWAKDGRQPDRVLHEAAINARLHFCNALIMELFDEEPALLKSSRIEWINFYNACTSGDYGMADRKAQPEQAGGIELHAFNLIHETEKCRTKLSKPWFL